MKTIERAEAAKLVHEGFGMTHGQRAALQKERLKELVAYARERSPLLKEMYGNLPEDFTLEDLPVMEKKAMTARYDEWVTDPEIRLPAVEAFCDRDASDGSLFLDQYTVLHTSGTTAKPMYMVRDGHRNAIHGQLMAQRLMNGVDPGLMNPTVHRTAAVIYAVHGSSSYEGFLRTQRAIPGFEGNMRAVSILNSIREIADELNGFQPEVLSGYGSVLPMLAVEKEAGRLDIPVKVIFNSAEGLSPENFLRVQKAFGCPVKNNYCMTEGGEIAMTVDGPDLLLNEDWVLVEPVDSRMRPVQDPEEWSAGILVTDLSNFVQPIIRYYVNDSVRVERCPEGQVRLPKLEIRGRASAMFTLAGVTFGAISIGAQAEFWSGVVDFQFVQVADDELQVRAVCNSSTDPAAVMPGYCAQLQEFFAAHGCPGAKVTWSPEQPVRNRQGGKTNRYIDLRK